eukprot:11085683-Karenia_brevis.AAC.1
MVKSNRLVFKGAGFVQFRLPSSLMKAWNYEHCQEDWGVDPLNHGVDPGQRGFLMIEETRWGARRCCLETSRSVFAIRDIMEQDNGQFVQRAHLDPDSSAGKSFMHNEGGGWA